MFGSIKDFTADQFVPTQWESTEQKARFAKQFIRFSQAAFAWQQFPHAFYLRLALTFGHIAHFNQHGFFEEFFSSTDGKVRFLKLTLAWSCPGEPSFTYCDVERALQSWLFQNGVLAKYEQRLSEEIETAERAELNRLQAKWQK